ncbi:MAG: N-acetyltransferase [Candidatus Acidiferrales bacterium]
MKARRFSSLAGFSLRLTREADFETLYAIDQVCYSATVAYTREELRWYMSLRGSECLVAEVRTKARSSSFRSRIAGFIVTASRTIHGHIVTIDVLEMYRRTGVGSALLRGAEEQMERRGVGEVWLETATNNEAAIAFWKKHGYRTHGRLPNYYPDGLDAFAMSKPLVATLSNKNGTEEK